MAQIIKIDFKSKKILSTNEDSLELLKNFDPNDVIIWKSISQKKK